MSRLHCSTVMAGFSPAIHDFPRLEKVVDARAKPEHDVFALVLHAKPEHDASTRISTPEASR